MSIARRYGKGGRRPARSSAGFPAGTPPANPIPAPNARSASGATSVTQFQPGHGWTALGGTLASNMNETTGSPYYGTQYAWFSGNGDNTVTGMRRVGLPSVDLTGRDVGLLLRVDNPNEIPTTGGSFLIYMGNSAFANFVTLSLANDSPFKFFPRRTTFATPFGGYWQYVTIPLDAATTPASYMSKSGAQTTAQILANVTDWQIYHRDPLATTPTRISVNEIFHLPKQSTWANGVACLTFDDGWASQLSAAAPYMTTAGGRGTAYAIQDSLGSAGYMTKAGLLTLQNTHSWQISVHTFKGADHVYPGYAGVSAADGIADAQAMRKWLRQNDLTGYNHLAYPHGAYCMDNAGMGTQNDRVDLTLAPYFKTMRTIYNQMPETLPAADPSKLRTYLATSGATTLAALKTCADVAKRTQSVMNVVFHKLVASGPLASDEWLISDFQLFVDYLGTIGMPMRTISEVYG